MVLKERELAKSTGQTITLNSGVKTDRIIVEDRERWRTQLQMLHFSEVFRKYPEGLKKQIVRVEKEKNEGLLLEH
ncbi:MAG: hypothetical protein SOW08_06455 [Lachnospiraceae bacterium]|nr:hypothetical protein [Lachnospiraceae bacterium]